MKIFVNVFGIFHGFSLATQLKKRHKKVFLLTSYPRFYFKEKSLQIYSTNLQLLNYLFYSKLKFKNILLNIALRKIHYFITSFLVRKKTTVITWGGTSNYYFKNLKHKNCLIVLERGSTHPRFQYKILKEEFQKYNLSYIDNEALLDLQDYEFKHSDYISIPSSFVKKTFLELGYSSEKLFVNPYGCDLSKFYKSKKEDTTFRIIFCGMASIQKGFHYLLEAFSMIDESYKIELWHIGSVQREIKPFIVKYQSNKIKYVGTVSKDKLVDFYSQGSVFVLPSLQEGLAMVMLEAMACGLPLICTPNTGAEDIITDGEEGFIVPIRDPRAIKNKIQFLYNHPNKCADMGYKSLKKVQNGFSWEDYGSRYSKFLKSLKIE